MFFLWQKKHAQRADWVAEKALSSEQSRTSFTNKLKRLPGLTATWQHWWVGAPRFQSRQSFQWTVSRQCRHSCLLFPPLQFLRIFFTSSPCDTFILFLLNVRHSDDFPDVGDACVTWRGVHIEEPQADATPANRKANRARDQTQIKPRLSQCKQTLQGARKQYDWRKKWMQPFKSIFSADVFVSPCWWLSSAWYSEVCYSPCERPRLANHLWWMELYELVRVCTGI